MTAPRSEAQKRYDELMNPSVGFKGESLLAKNTVFIHADAIETQDEYVAFMGSHTSHVVVTPGNRIDKEPASVRHYAGIKRPSIRAAQAIAKDINEYNDLPDVQVPEHLIVAVMCLLEEAMKPPQNQNIQQHIDNAATQIDTNSAKLPEGDKNRVLAALVWLERLPRKIQIDICNHISNVIAVHNTVQINETVQATRRMVNRDTDTVTVILPHTWMYLNQPNGTPVSEHRLRYSRSAETIKVLDGSSRVPPREALNNAVDLFIAGISTTDLDSLRESLRKIPDIIIDFAPGETMTKILEFFENGLALPDLLLVKWITALNQKLGRGTTKTMPVQPAPVESSTSSTRRGNSFEYTLGNSGRIKLLVLPVATPPADAEHFDNLVGPEDVFEIVNTVYEQLRKQGKRMRRSDLIVAALAYYHSTLTTGNNVERLSAVWQLLSTGLLENPHRPTKWKGLTGEQMSALWPRVEKLLADTSRRKSVARTFETFITRRNQQIILQEIKKTNASEVRTFLVTPEELKIIQAASGNFDVVPQMEVGMANVLESELPLTGREQKLEEELTWWRGTWLLWRMRREALEIEFPDAVDGKEGADRLATNTFITGVGSLLGLFSPILPIAGTITDLAADSATIIKPMRERITPDVPGEVRLLYTVLGEGILGLLAIPTGGATLLISSHMLDTLHQYFKGDKPRILEAIKILKHSLASEIVEFENAELQAALHEFLPD